MKNNTNTGANNTIQYFIPVSCAIYPTMHVACTML